MLKYHSIKLCIFITSLYTYKIIRALLLSLRNKYLYLESVLLKYDRLTTNLMGSSSVRSSVFFVRFYGKFMKNAHTFCREAGELVFVDATGNTDRLNSRLFLVMAATKCGGLPLGM